MSQPSDSPKPRRRRPSFRALTLIVLIAIVCGLLYFLYPRALPQSEAVASLAVSKIGEQLRAVSDFDDISDPTNRSLALFQEVGRVLQSPRCMNCHPRSDRPTQTSAMRPHTPWVSRGLDGGGEVTMRCSTCHHDDNSVASGVPGNPKWRLAPIEMAWQGKSLGEICRQLLDPSRSHMTRDELLRHMAQDELVGWAWHPGGNREPAPGSQQEFGALVAAWLNAGAACPE